jgi:DNA-directed RNA polymerase specialized sigma subunit
MMEEGDQELIARLYSNGQTEAEVAKDFGMNQGTISRRKTTILIDLRRSLLTAGKNQE